MTTPKPESAPVAEQNIQHRCPRMSQHVYPGNLPVPCGDCYSLRVTAERIPWEPSTDWSPLYSPGACGICGRPLNEVGTSRCYEAHGISALPADAEAGR